MSYTALYRKFRPSKFEEMVGQEHITKTLQNQIVQERVGHAYLFSGGRGTGKTTVAKILARAVNCVNPKNGEPCNECEICKGILTGALTDVVEMDAASNNGVEDIRTIRDEVNFLPTSTKYRVYIIDEVHMLSPGAFNALLKTLEEPPKHVKFFLATTEPQKLPPTILSRCQRFEFKRISEENIIKRLKEISKISKIKISEEALKMIAVLSEGALRDAISILERCIQEEGNGEINEESVRDLVGIPKMAYISKVVEAVIDRDIENLLKSLKVVIDEGKDIDNFLWEIIKYIKDILVYKAVGEIELYNKQEKETIGKLSEKTSKTRLLELIYQLSELANNIKWSTQKVIMLETGMIRTCFQEEQMGNNSNREMSEKNTLVQKSEKNNKENEEKPKVKKVVVKEGTSDNLDSSYLSYWPKVLDTLRTKGKAILSSNLVGTKAKKVNDLQVEIEFEEKINPLIKTLLEQPENKDEITKLITEEEGKPIQVKYVENASVVEVVKVETEIEKTDSQETGMPINIIDE